MNYVSLQFYSWFWQGTINNGSITVKYAYSDRFYMSIVNFCYGNGECMLQYLGYRIDRSGMLFFSPVCTDVFYWNRS